MIVLLGGTGFVGDRFRQFLERRNIPFCMLTRHQIDYFNVDQLGEALASLHARLVINCAGYTGSPNVDACEDHKAECLAANAVLPARIAEACARIHACLGHVSSGCIYTGGGPNGRGFTETDPPNFTFRHNNCSFYSGTKALGEELLQPYENVYLWRLRIPFDHIDSPRNYLSKLMRYDRLLEATNSLSWLDEFVAACFQCWRESLPTGIYNLTNTGSIKTSEVVELIRKLGRSNRDFSFFRDEHEFMALAARSPRSNCILDNSRALQAGLKLSHVQDALAHCLKTWTSNRAPQVRSVTTSKLHQGTLYMPIQESQKCKILPRSTRSA